LNTFARIGKRLQEDDTFSPEQAERIAEILSDLDVVSATKEDLDETESRLHERIDQVETRLDTRIEEVETRLDSRIDEVEARLTQRIELSEERLGKQIESIRTQLLQWMLASVTGVATIVAAMVALINYLMG
jgi:chromosome segregation ATPase